MLTPRRRAPDHFGLLGVERQSVSPHPRWHVISTDKHPLTKAVNGWWLTEPVDLGIVRESMWVKMMRAWSAAADRRYRAEIESVRGPTPAVQRKAPPMAMNRTPIRDGATTGYSNRRQTSLLRPRLDHRTHAVVEGACHGQRCWRLQEASA